jgi:hypothetical protein
MAGKMKQLRPLGGHRFWAYDDGPFTARIIDEDGFYYMIRPKHDGLRWTRSGGCMGCVVDNYKMRTNTKTISGGPASNIVEVEAEIRDHIREWSVELVHES